ncbi:MAG: FHA domain-containing protein [Gemmatimonadetes bacterium]|nr:FHA domain-containing protein [Gemmatimonadota bacterium]
MFAQFTYRDGPAVGATRVVGHDFATLGRDPQADVPLDSVQYPEVSVRHAAVFKQGGGYLLRDLGSTNGTFLNGTRVRGDRPIEVGDRIQLGPGGPVVEFGATAVPPHGNRSAAGATPSPASRLEIHAPRQRTTSPVGYRRPNPRRRPWLVGLVTVVVLGASAAIGLGYQARRAAEVLAARRDALQRQADDVRNRLDGARAPNDGLRAAVRAAISGLETVRSDLGAAASDSAVDRAAARLDSLATAVAPVLAAIATDPTGARREGVGRVAVIIGEFVRGATAAASGIALLRIGDTTWFATERRTAVDSIGVPAIRFAVIADGDRAAALGRLVRADDSLGVAIVAVIRVESPEPSPSGNVPRIGETLVQVGFPFGADSLGEWRSTGAAAQAAVATVTAVDSTAVRLTGYGVGGWPGSALLDRAGAVVGMVSGPPGGDLRVIPIARLRRLVETKR